MHICGDGASVREPHTYIYTCAYMHMDIIGSGDNRERVAFNFALRNSTQAASDMKIEQGAMMDFGSMKR